MYLLLNAVSISSEMSLVQAISSFDLPTKVVQERRVEFFENVHLTGLYSLSVMSSETLSILSIKSVVEIFIFELAV